MPISSEELTKLAKKTGDLRDYIDQIPPDSRVKIISAALLSLLNNPDQTASTNIINSFLHLDQNTQEQIFVKTLEGVDKKNHENERFTRLIGSLVTTTLVKVYHSPEQFPTNFIHAALGALEVEYLVKCLESLNNSTTQFSKPVEGFIIGVLVKAYDSSSALSDAAKTQAFNEVFKRIPNYMPEFVTKLFQNTPSYLPDSTWIFGKAGECFEAVLNGKEIGGVTKSFICKYASKITGAITSSKYMEETPSSVIIPKPAAKAVRPEEQITAKL